VHLLVGLDIHQTEVRLLQLTKIKQQIILKNFTLAALPEGAMVDGIIKQISNVQTAVDAVVAKTVTFGSAVAIGLPGNQVTSKQLKFPREWPLAAIATEIADNLYQYLPDGDKEVWFDFSLLQNQSSDYQEVVFVAAAKNYVQPFLDIAMKAGLLPKVIDVAEHIYSRLSLEVFNLLIQGEFALVAPRFRVAYGLACRSHKTW